MPTRNVVLTDHQSAVLDRLVAEGRYQNASEAMREGLRLIEDREDARRAFGEYLDRLRAEDDARTESDYVTVEEAFAQLRAKVRDDA